MNEKGVSMKKLMFVLLCSLAASCAMDYSPSYRFNEVQAVNLTGDSIRDVRIRIAGSEKMLDCDDVNANAMCADRFAHRPYPQQGIDLSWTHPDGSSKSESMNPDIPIYFNSAFPLRIVMEIRADGSVKPFYEQEEPGRGSVYY
jgi:hypothetical protein